MRKKPVDKTLQRITLSSGLLEHNEQLRAEVQALNGVLNRQTAGYHQAIRLMTSYAARYGYCLGGLEAIALGHAQAKDVLRAVKKYELTQGRDAATDVKERQRVPRP
jgi:hypothetical protein